MNERYLIYCQTYGKTPEEMMEYDRERYPGGVMCGYILFISALSNLFARKCPQHFIGAHIANHDAFTEFIKENAKQI